MSVLGPCTYVTRGWGIHDARWAKTFQDIGFRVDTVSCQRDGIRLSDLPSTINNPGPVIAGPLDSVTPMLTGIQNRLVGLSWASDLLMMHQRKQDLSWLNKLDAVIVDSSATRAIVLESGLKPKDIHVIPWGVNVDLFSPTGPAINLSTWGVPSSTTTLLSLRAHEPIYRVADIIESFARLIESEPRTHLIVGNGGSLRVELEEQVKALKVTDHVTFIGSLPEFELPSLMRACHFYITASDIDGSSVTLLQAMSCGLPVIASDIPGNQDWVHEHKTGRLFRVGSPEALARTLQSALNRDNDEKTTHMAANSRNHILAKADWSRNSKGLAYVLAPEQRDVSWKRPTIS